jgi:hypothetical protein
VRLKDLLVSDDDLRFLGLFRHEPQGNDELVGNLIDFFHVDDAASSTPQYCMYGFHGTAR